MTIPMKCLVQLLCVDVNAGEPAPVAGLAVIPPDDVLVAPGLLAALVVLDHVLVRLRLGVDARLRALHGKHERVDDDDRVAHGLALEHAHDLDVAARTRVDRHLEKGERRDAEVLEVVRILGPRRRRGDVALHVTDRCDPGSRARRCRWGPRPRRTSSRRPSSRPRLPSASPPSPRRCSRAPNASARPRRRPRPTCCFSGCGCVRSARFSPHAVSRRRRVPPRLCGWARKSRRCARECWWKIEGRHTHARLGVALLKPARRGPPPLGLPDA